MAERDPNDTASPVVLQEPARDRPSRDRPSRDRPSSDKPANDWREGFTLQGEETGPPGLHPGWAGMLAPGEAALWQGRPSPDPRLRRVKGSLGGFLIAGAFVFLALNMGIATSGILPIVAFAAIGFWVLRAVRERRLGPSDRVYLLTDRAAYLARSRDGVLTEVVSYPITPTLHLGLGPRSVSFTTRRNAQGEVEAEGFLDIPDAAAVCAMIRDLQKGKA